MFINRGRVGEATYVSIQIPNLTGRDLNIFANNIKIETDHGRYKVVIDLTNSFLDVLNDLSIKYLEIGRTSPIHGFITIRSSLASDGHDVNTGPIKFYITNIRSFGDSSRETIRIYGVDSYSWFMNIGRPIGSVYRGSISSVIRQVVEETAPQIDLNIVQTTDDPLGTWYTNRLSPIKFVDRLLEIATVATKSMTPWIIGIENDTVSMQDESSAETISIGHYNIGDNSSERDILFWDVIANGSHSNESIATTTSGIDTELGVVYNNILSMDSTTENKKYPLISDYGFSNPKSEYGIGSHGYSYVEPLPDSAANNRAIPYSEYIKIKALNEYYRRTKKLNAAIIKVNGHGVYHNTLTSGLGVIFIEALTTNGQKHQLHGNWIVDEFKHIVSTGGEENDSVGWVTELTLYRMDKNSTGTSIAYDPKNE